MRKLENWEVEVYRRAGYVIARGFLQPDEIVTLDDWIEEVEQRAGDDSTLHSYYESAENGTSQLLRRVEYFGSAHPGLYDFSTSEGLLSAISHLLGTKSVLFKEKINFKLPGGGGYPAHRDGHFWWTDADGERLLGWYAYASRFLSVLIGVDPASPENGCLEIAPGGHDCAATAEPAVPLTSAEAQAMAFEPCVTKPGDVVFFDALAPHRSAANTSSQARRALYLTYNPCAEGDHRQRYFTDKRASLARRGLKYEDGR